MPKTTEKKNEKIQLWVTVAQKNTLKRMAGIEGKTLTNYMLDAVLLKKGKKENIDSKNEIKRRLYVLTKLTLLIGYEQIKSQDVIMKFYEKSENEAEEIYGKD